MGLILIYEICGSNMHTKLVKMSSKSQGEAS